MFVCLQYPLKDCVHECTSQIIVIFSCLIILNFGALQCTFFMLYQIVRISKYIFIIHVNSVFLQLNRYVSKILQTYQNSSKLGSDEKTAINFNSLPTFLFQTKHQTRRFNLILGLCHLVIVVIFFYSL